MSRLALTLLTRICHCRGLSLPASSVLLKTLDLAAAAGDGCSTSAQPTTWGCNRTSAGIRVQAWRSLHRYNYIQPVDTNHINTLLDSTNVLEHAAIPILHYGAWFDPDQVTRTLQRLPRMLRHQRRKGSRAAAEAASVTSWRLLDALGSRLAQVAPECTNEQLTRALWAFGVSRRHHGEVVGAACKQLSQRLTSLTMSQLATTAWSLAAATSRAPKPMQEPVRAVLQSIARHLVSTRPADLSTGPATADVGHLPPAAAGHSGPEAAPAASPAAAALTPAADVVAAAVAAGQSALEADRPWMDHRSALKLAWAFSTLGVRDPLALDVIADAAAARISSQLQAHDRSTGALAPRATYIYWTIRGWQAWPRPRPQRARTGGRPSRYLRDERPRVVLRDFTLPSLAPLLSAFRRLGHRHEGLLQACAQHVVASAGPALRVAPTDLARVLGSLESLRFRSAPALATLLSSSRVSALPAPLLARLTVMAAEWGVPARPRRDGGSGRTLYSRLARQLVARAWVAVDGDGAAVTVGSKELILGGGGSAEEEAEEEGGDVEAEVPQLDLRARESWERRLPSLTWRTDEASLEREEEVWGRTHRRPEDGCEATDLTRAVLGLAKAGYVDADPESAPLVSALVARVWSHLHSLPGDALADMALAAVHYGNEIDTQTSYDLPKSLGIIRDATNAVVYGSEAPPPPAVTVDGLSQRIMSMTGYGRAGSGTGAIREADSADAAAALRRELGLTPGGALRLATALTLRPEAAAGEKELRVVLSLVDVASAGRRRLGELIRRMRQGGRNAALPARLLEAAGEVALPR